MHVAFLITRSDAVGGATIHVRDMASNLNRRGYQATVLVGGTGGSVTEELAAAGVPFRVVSWLDRSIHPVKDLVAIGQITAELRRLRPDIVSTHTAKAGWLGRIACGILGIPVLFTPHGWAISDRVSRHAGHAFRLAEKAAAPLAAYIVNVSEAERSLARAHRIGKEGQMVVVHNGVEDVPPELLAEPSLEPPRIVMVARFEEPKDHRTLLQALAKLAHLPWSLELVGDGPRISEVQAVAASLGLHRRVQFPGSGKAVAEQLAASQLFVLSSRSEGFPRSILEAMRAGLPVVASNVGGVKEAVLHGVTGFVVPKCQPERLTVALADLLQSAELRQKMGTAARRRYEDCFTFQQMFDKTLRLYRSLSPVAATTLAAGSRGA